MNGVMNAIFIITMFMCLVAFDFLYTIGDQITDGINNAVEPNAYTASGYSAYTTLRSMMYNLVIGIMTPFLLFLSFFSSFVNRNQNIVTYCIQAFAILMLTPLLIYLFADIFADLTSFSMLDPAYIATNYFDAFMYILVVNALLSLASFVFIKPGVVAT